MRFEKRLPRDAAATDRVDPVLGEHAPDRAPRDRVSQVLERALDAGVSPTRIVSSHLDDETLDLAGNSRSPGAALRASIVLLRDELPVPAKQRVRRDDGRDFSESRSPDRMSVPRKSASLCIRESNSSSAELLAQHKVLRLQLRDQLALLAVQPSRQNEEHELNGKMHLGWISFEHG